MDLITYITYSILVKGAPVDNICQTLNIQDHHKEYAHGFCLVVFCGWVSAWFYPYPSGLLHWHFAPVPVMPPWRIWINESHEHMNSSDAGNRIFWLWGSIPWLLMPRLLKSPMYQQAWYQTTCIVIPDLTSSTWVKPNPRYNSKWEYIFHNLQNNWTC